MRLVVFRHGQDRDHRDRALLAETAAGAFIQRCKVGVEVAGVAAAAGDFLLRSGNLAQRLGVVRDIGQDDKHLHIFLEGQILGGGQRHTRRCNTLDSRVVGEVREHDRAVDGAGAAELLNEVLGFLEGDADRGKDNREVFTVAQHSCLTRDLRGQRCMRQAGRGEDRQLLAADEGVQTVNGRDAGLDELCRVGACRRVHRQAVDIEMLFRQDLRAAVDRLAHAVEDAAKHILGNAELQRVAKEANLGLREVDALRAFKQLHDRRIALDLKHLAAADFAVGQLDLGQLVVGDAFDLLHQHQRAGDLPNGLIFFNHCSSPPATISLICAVISVPILV